VTIGFRRTAVLILNVSASKSHDAQKPALNPCRCSFGRVDLDIQDGWHFNANPASAPELTPTAVDLRGDAPVEVIKVTYPEGKPLRASYAEPIIVIDGQARILVTAKLADSAVTDAGGTLPLAILLQFQACDDARCLPPTEKIIDVPLKVAE
jgi:hypothetical protein